MLRGCDTTVSGWSGVPWVGQVAEALVGRSTGSVLGQKAQGLLISRVHGRRGAPTLPPWLVSAPGVALGRLASLCTIHTLPSPLPKMMETPLLKVFANRKYLNCLFLW